jgi:tetratricopeptide (TPR) repeat protein
LWIVAAIAAVVCLGPSLCLGVQFLRKRSEKRAGESIEELLAKARITQEQGDLEHALELYEVAIETDPQTIPAYVEASTLLIDMEREEDAIEILLQGIEANPDAANLHGRTAGTALLLNKLDIAKTQVEWILQEAPDQPATYAFEGILLLEQGLPCSEARPSLDKALRAEPESAWAHYGMALCEAQEGNPDGTRGELLFVIGNDETPVLLRKRAEEMLNRMEDKPPPGDDGPKPADEAVLNHFDILLAMTEDVQNDDLRQHLQGTLEEARRIWKEGNQEHAIQLVEELDAWVQENRDGLGTEKTRMLTLELRNVLRLMR